MSPWVLLADADTIAFVRSQPNGSLQACAELALTSDAGRMQPEPQRASSWFGPEAIGLILADCVEKLGGIHPANIRPAEV